MERGFRAEVGVRRFRGRVRVLDLPHIPEPTRSEMTKELELRSQQLQLCCRLFTTE
jgi:hypothetical protein